MEIDEKEISEMIDTKIEKSLSTDKIAILSYSGGIVSSTYLLDLLNSNEYNKVYALFFDYDSQYQIEKQSADEVIKFLESLPNISDKLEYNKISIRVTEKSSKTISNIEDSDTVSQKELFLNIDALVSLAEKIYEDKYNECVIDIHLGLTNDMDEKTIDDYNFVINNVKDRLIEGAITTKTLYSSKTKADTLFDGIKLCSELIISYDDFYKRTNTVPRTIKINNRLYADITDEHSASRALAFHQNNLVDPIKYANENGVMTWDEVIAYFGGSSATDTFGNVVLTEIESVPIEEVERKSKPIKEKTIVEQPAEAPFEPESPHRRRSYSQVTILNN